MKELHLSQMPPLAIFSIVVDLFAEDKAQYCFETSFKRHDLIKIRFANWYLISYGNVNLNWSLLSSN